MKEREEALKAKALYNLGIITRDEAKERIEPYKRAFDEAAKRLAEKYGMKPQRFSLASFLR